MSANAETGLSAPPLRTQLRRATFDDHEKIRRLEATLDPEASSLGDWRALWAESPLWPALQSTWPIGWVLETADGEIVGCLSNVPLRYHFRGQSLLAASGRGWVVAPKYRGFALWLLEERFTQPSVDLFVDTTIGALALEAFDEFAKRIPVGDWETIAYFVTEYRAFVTRALQKLNMPFAQFLVPIAGAGLQLEDAIFSRRLPRAGSSFAIEATDEFDSRFDQFWDELLRANTDTLLAARDVATLRWHFSTAMRKRHVWILTASRNGRLRAYCILKRQGTEFDLYRMRLVDYQTIEPEVDFLPDMLRVALARCLTEKVCVLDKLGAGVPKFRAFDGFAPHRRRQTWPYFYRAADPGLASELCQPRFWDPSEYDGDASLG